MPAGRKVTTALLLALAAIVAIVIPASCFYDRVDPASLKSELIAAGIVGKSPDEAVATLKRLVLPRGCKLSIGEFDPATRVLYASVSNAKRVPGAVWRALVTISFDVNKRVQSVQVDLVGSSL